METNFGNETVTPDERRRRIAAVFQAVAPRYDLMNDLMSFGIHRLWKRGLVGGLTLPENAVVVDLAGGTGDVARAIYRRTGIKPIIVDASWNMMATGRRNDTTPLLWVAGEGERLPLADDSLDLVTLAFGLRNMTSIDGALVEILRCLKPGGQFICLEFSTPVFWLKPFYDLYSRLVIPRLGAWVAREPAAYQYLIDSIRRFPDQRALCRILETAGFDQVRHASLSFGISALHYGRKPPTPAKGSPC